MTTTTTAKALKSEFTFAQVKEGEIYRLEEGVSGATGYNITAGDIMVTSVYPGMTQLSVYNFTAQKKETLYPVREGQVFRMTRLAKEASPELQRRHLPNFVGFGASNQLGTDPEVFAVDAEGQVIPAYKFAPDKATALKKGFQPSVNSYHSTSSSFPYWDGFQAEYNVKSVACIAHLTDYIQNGLRLTASALKQFDPKGKLVGTSVMPVPQVELANGKEEHIQLGCLPSENAYNMHGDPVGNGRDLPIRFAGFHMHFAMNNAGEERQQVIRRIVLMMDKLCGVLSVAALAGLEDPMRRKFYGLAGEYRLPAHGLEWRVLSSAVLWHPALVHLHFNMARAAMQIVEKGLDRLWNGTDAEARDIVNGLDVEGAKRVIDSNRDLYLGCLMGSYGYWGHNDRPAQVLDNLIVPGFAQVIDLDLAKNWLLSGGWIGHSGATGCHFAHFAKHHFKWMV